MTTFAPQVAPRPKVLRSFAAKDLMTRNPLVLEKQIPIRRASALLQIHRLDAAPVVDELGRLVGVITNVSCAAWEESSQRSSAHGFVRDNLYLTPVSKICSPIVESIRDDASNHEVIDRLAERRARRIYVVNKRHELVGVVSISDLIRHLTQRSAGSLSSRATAPC